MKKYKLISLLLEVSMLIVVVLLFYFYSQQANLIYLSITLIVLGLISILFNNSVRKKYPKRQQKPEDKKLVFTLLGCGIFVGLFGDKLISNFSFTNIYTYIFVVIVGIVISIIVYFTIQDWKFYDLCDSKTNLEVSTDEKN